MASPAAVSFIQAPMAAPTVSATCTTGVCTTATFAYEIVAYNSNGATTPASPVSATVTNVASLVTTTNQNIITIPALSANISGYYIYRTLATSATGNSATTGYIGNAIASGSFTDNGLTATGIAPPASPVAGSLSVSTTCVTSCTATYSYVIIAYNSVGLPAMPHQF